MNTFSRAGFLDGINPCVFATLIFFISLLSVSKVKSRKFILAGSIYCFACFAAYLALGFGLFRFLKLFPGYQLIQLGINIAMAIILDVRGVSLSGMPGGLRKQGDQIV